ncbi:MAG: DUF4115 domain-containing protein [Gammaproteobacteria bacterium]|nr:DUF4115 domain-containing protein [Gammaproteobacteria bacterium]
MSGEKDKPADEQSPDEEQGPVCGERLAAARREQQISVLAVAKELHLDETKVRALEQNDFDLLGPPVFAKGHLRKYARLVGVGEDDVFADYYQLTRSQRAEPIVIGRSKIRREPTPGPWVAAIVVIIAVALAYWWFAAREPGPATPRALEDPADTTQRSGPAQQQEPVEQAGPRAPPAAADAVADRDDTIALAAAATDSEPAESAAVAVAQVAAAAADAEAADPEIDGLRLTLTFSGDCWTEITDADGQRLFFGMGRGGRSAELTGRAPVRVLFGNADNVSVQVNGADYPIPAPDPANRTATLTIRNP